MERGVRGVGQPGRGRGVVEGWGSLGEGEGWQRGGAAWERERGVRGVGQPGRGRGVLAGWGSLGEG